MLEATLPGATPPQQLSTVAPYAAAIAGYRARGMELAAIRARLEEVHGHPVSYHAIWRLVRHLEPKQPEAVVRVEAKPGSEAQVDFGYAGLTLDPATGAARKTWVFVMVLSWSRHLYAELVFDQRVATWLLCHRHAFDAFGGIPARLVPDNLKAAVVRASFTEPVAQRSYRECAEHYGFLIDPNPPRSPHLKGKVEQGGVHYVARNFLAGRTPQPIDVLNAALGRWCVETAGRRVHGTTKQAPLARFTTVERATLRPLPPTPYDPAEWKRVRVYRDCYLTFAGAYYSVPYRLVGQEVWARGGARTVEVYTADHQLVATHTRAAAPGERQTCLDHLPPEKVPNLTITRETCRRHAAGVGPATAQLVEGLLAHRPEDRLRTAGRLLRLAQRTSPERLERACARACAFGAEDYPTVKRILDEELDSETPPAPATTPPRASVFVRQAGEFVASLLGGSR
ncbi:MAG: IS21 family transposase [Myxococcales bacterium]